MANVNAKLIIYLQKSSFFTKKTSESLVNSTKYSNFATIFH